MKKRLIDMVDDVRRKQLFMSAALAERMECGEGFESDEAVGCQLIMMDMAQELDLVIKRLQQKPNSEN